MPNPTALRSCFRSTSSSLRCQQALAATKCIASAVCPAKRFIASSSPSFEFPQAKSKSAIRMSRRVRRDTTLGLKNSAGGGGRGFSSSLSLQNESSPLGTVGKGSEGVAESLTTPPSTLSAPEHLNEKEKSIFELLNKELNPKKLEVQDISGGCGSMYGIEVVSERFRGLSMLKQQRLVNSVLGEEIKGWHGVQLRTKAE